MNPNFYRKKYSTYRKTELGRRMLKTVPVYCSETFCLQKINPLNR